MHFLKKTNQQMWINCTLFKARVPMQAAYVHVTSDAVRQRARSRSANCLFISESDNLPDTGTLRSTCYELY